MIFSLFKFKRNKKNENSATHKKRSTKNKRGKASTKKATKKITKVKTKIKKPIPKKKKIEIVGKVIHYFPKVKAAVIKVKKGPIVIGDSLQIKGRTTDFKQKVTSMQIDRKPITKATKGKIIGLKVKKRVRINDKVYKM